MFSGVFLLLQLSVHVVGSGEAGVERKERFRKLAFKGCLLSKSSLDIRCCRVSVCYNGSGSEVLTMLGVLEAFSSSIDAAVLLLSCERSESFFVEGI